MHTEQQTPQIQAAPNKNKSLRSRRSKLRFPALLTVIGFAFAGASCSSDDNNDTVAGAVVTEVGSAISDAGAAVSDAGASVSEAVSPDTNVAGAAEGPAKGLATKMATELKAMAGGGEPTVANFNAAAAALTGTAKMTGLEDTDNNGKDDDSKVTITVDDDKACLQNQNAAWEVTDDEC
jgi:hypothetical protein